MAWFPRAADSTGQCNSLVEFLWWCHELERLTGTSVELGGGDVEVGLVEPATFLARSGLPAG